MGQRVNKKTLAKILDKSERTLTEWQAAGMPMLVNAGRGSSNTYDTAAVIQWMLDRSASSGATESSKDRRERLQGDLIEAQLAEKSGQLVPADEIVFTWNNMIQSARNILLSMADKLKVEIDTSYATDVDVELINAHTNEALSKLAAYQPEHTEANDHSGSAEIRATIEDQHD